MADLSMLNPQQRNAVRASMDHNVLLLAPAGSGKTMTLVKRTEYLIDDCGVSPESIMLVTFTNKAATEMKERISRTVPEGCGNMWIGTFHSICSRILREHGSVMGINSFTIMSDTYDMIKDIIKKVTGFDADKQTVKEYKAKISRYKSNLRNPKAVWQLYKEGRENESFAKVYTEYQEATWRDRTFDFDDLIIYTILLIGSYKNVARIINDKFKYITADEFQDVSADQYTLIRLLTGENNIMAVGDFSQSIYGFRNARPEYLDRFEKLFGNTRLMMLEENYRSTQTIVSAANAVILNNKSGKKVEMLTANEEGAKITTISFDSTGKRTAVDQEAMWVCLRIMELVKNGQKYGDFAIINRTNLQNREIEKALAGSGIPHVVMGGSSFWNSTEMRDILSYCRSAFNKKDKKAFTRALNTLEGVGSKAVERICSIAEAYGDTHAAIPYFISMPGMRLTAGAQLSLNIFQDIITKSKSCYEVAIRAINDLKYKARTPENMDALNGVVETFKGYEAECPDPGEVLDKISLIADARKEDKAEADAVKVMTAHACKGLEFHTVFICGAEESLFPHYRAVKSGKPSAIEEERRLFYVALTRAKRKLYITSCTQRGAFDTKQSRFIKEIPEDLIEECYM